MKKVYFLGSCDTCLRIIKQFNLSDEFELHDIKKVPISPIDLTELKNRAGSYENLFSKRARKYKSMGLSEMDLKENDFKKYILSEYTFLKRPVVVLDDQIFIGSAKAVQAALEEALT